MLRARVRTYILLLVAILAGCPLHAQYSGRTPVDDCLQYVPLAAGIGLGWTGVKAQDGGWDRIMVAGMGFASECVIVGALKYGVHEERPYGEEFDSFPSGHSATAFLGAEIVRHEYGWGWGAGAYALAGGIAALRIYHHQHYWWDAVAGAGCGILSANIGYWLLEPAHTVLDRMGIGRRDEAPELTLAPMYDPRAGAVGPAFALKF